MAISWPLSPSYGDWFETADRGWYRANPYDRTWQLYGYPTERVIIAPSAIIDGAETAMSYFVTYDSGRIDTPSYPAGASGYPTSGSWTSSDTAMASIDDNGIITWGPGHGTVDISLDGSPAVLETVTLHRPVLAHGVRTDADYNSWSYVSGPVRRWDIAFLVGAGGGFTADAVVGNTDPSVADAVQISSGIIEITPLAAGVTTITVEPFYPGVQSFIYTFTVFGSDPTV